MRATQETSSETLARGAFARLTLVMGHCPICGVAGLKNVHFLDITNSSTNMDKSYMGCGNHPSWIGHEKAAEIAIPKVKAALGW